MPEADQEKRTAENYEITQAVRIGGKEVVFGITVIKEPDA